MLLIMRHVLPSINKDPTVNDETKIILEILRRRLRLRGSEQLDTKDFVFFISSLPKEKKTWGLLDETHKGNFIHILGNIFDRVEIRNIRDLVIGLGKLGASWDELSRYQREACLCMLERKIDDHLTKTKSERPSALDYCSDARRKRILDLCDMCSTFAKMGVCWESETHLDKKFREKLLEDVRLHIGSFNHQDITTFCLSCSKIKIRHYHLNDSLQNALLNRFIETIPLFNAQDLSNGLLGLSKIFDLTIPDTLKQKLLRFFPLAIQRNYSIFIGQHVSNIIYALGRLGITWDSLTKVRVDRDLMCLVTQHQGKFNFQALANILHGFNKLRIELQKHLTLLRYLLTNASKLIHTSKPQEVVSILRSLKEMNILTDNAKPARDLREDLIVRAQMLKREKRFNEREEENIVQVLQDFLKGLLTKREKQLITGCLACFQTQERGRRQHVASLPGAAATTGFSFFGKTQNPCYENSQGHPSLTFHN